jgi:probable H4MPT-linked C1 transfer pathway protein
LVDGHTAAAVPRLAAASNWHALARFAGRFAPAGPALLFDVGSTTCDLIPLLDGQPATEGQDDTGRLLAGELVYTGVERSPVCGVARTVPYRGQQCLVAHELFATLRDVYLALGDLPERPDDTETADGRPATHAAAVARLGRMLCADHEQFSDQDATSMAQAVAEAQVDLVSDALQRVLARLPTPPQTVILAGHGDFLARRVLARFLASARVLSLVDQLGTGFSRSATAYALAVLARECVHL